MTTSEENYLKVIYHLSQVSSKEINTNAIAGMLDAKASSVTDMIQKLAEKEFVSYIKYHGVLLTEKGLFTAKMIIRKHRLWETFLVEKLNFSWDEVHEIAEELEHINSEVLINRLDTFLDYPSLDPHGDPIPNALGKIQAVSKKLLLEVALQTKVKCVGVKDTSTNFLQFLNQKGIALGSVITILEKEFFAETLQIEVNNQILAISNKIANNIYVQ